MESPSVSPSGCCHEAEYQANRVLLLALVVTACGKKEAAFTTEIPRAAPISTASETTRAKPNGVWARDPLADGAPVWMEFRADGAATLKHQHPDGSLTTNVGKLTFQEGPPTGVHLIQVKFARGTQSLRVAFKGDELAMMDRDHQPTLIFRRPR